MESLRFSLTRTPFVRILAERIKRTYSAWHGSTDTFHKVVGGGGKDQKCVLTDDGIVAFEDILVVRVVQMTLNIEFVWRWRYLAPSILDGLKVRYRFR
jgi:hypothetical protein